MCQTCRKSGVGACIQCDAPNCGSSYHVRCAARSQIIQEWDKMEELLGDIELKDKNFIPIFCSKHREQGYKNFAEKQADTTEPKAGSKKKAFVISTKYLLEVGLGVSLEDINQAKQKTVVIRNKSKKEEAKTKITKTITKKKNEVKVKKAEAKKKATPVKGKKTDSKKKAAPVKVASKSKGGKKTLATQKKASAVAKKPIKAKTTSEQTKVPVIEPKSTTPAPV